jgi:hypothetical protein
MKREPTKPDLQMSLFNRDQGIARVQANSTSEWKAAVWAITKTLKGQEVIAEDIRIACENVGLFAHKPNAWGAETRSMIEQGWLKPLNVPPRPMRAPKSHARKSPVYLVTPKW